MKALSFLAWLLVIVGALNWGLWGFFQFDFIAWLFKSNTDWMARLIYALIGLAGVWSLSKFCRCCKTICCCSGKATCPCGRANCNCKRGGKSCNM